MLGAGEIPKKCSMLAFLLGASVCYLLYLHYGNTYEER